jgi:hypothetical protein
MRLVCGSGVVDTAINHVLHTIQYKAADSLTPFAGLVGSTIHEWLALFESCLSDPLGASSSSFLFSVFEVD